MLEDPEARALYLFPTKALAQDQIAGAARPDRAQRRRRHQHLHLRRRHARRRAPQGARAAGHIVVTNPDMLHTGILPHHTKWVKLFENLRYVVDRRAAPLPRRLRQPRRERHPAAAAHLPLLRLRPDLHLLLGDDRQPAANWREHIIARAGRAHRRQRRAARAEGRRRLQPAGRQPRAGHPRRRRRAPRATSRRACSSDGVQTIVFAPCARARRAAAALPARGAAPSTRPADTDAQVEGYRGGYLPNERRAIERGLRERRDPRRRRDQRARAGRRHRRPRCGGAHRLPRHARQRLAADRARRPAPASSPSSVLVASSRRSTSTSRAHPEYLFDAPPEAALDRPRQPARPRSATSSAPPSSCRSSDERGRSAPDAGRTARPARRGGRAA